MNPKQVLKDIDSIDEERSARRFWDVLWPFLESSGAPLLFDLKSDGFAICAVETEQPYAMLRLIEGENGEIKCARFSRMPGFLGMIGTIIPIKDQAKAARIYRRVVEHLLAA